MSGPQKIRRNGKWGLQKERWAEITTRTAPAPLVSSPKWPIMFDGDVKPYYTIPYPLRSHPVLWTEGQKLMSTQLSSRPTYSTLYLSCAMPCPVEVYTRCNKAMNLNLRCNGLEKQSLLAAHIVPVFVQSLLTRVYGWIMEHPLLMKARRSSHWQLFEWRTCERSIGCIAY